MPRVPTYERRVDTRPLPAPQRGPIPGPEVFGGQQAEALQRLGGTITQAGAAGLREAFYQQNLAKRQARESLLFESDNKLAVWEQRYLHDPQTGVLNVKGKQSLALPDTVRADYDKVVDEIGAELTGAELQTAFHRRSVERWQRINANVQKHVHDENLAYDLGVSDHGMALAKSAAIQNYTDPVRINAELEDGLVKARRLAALRGFGPDDAYTKDLALTFTTGVHEGVINRQINDNLIAAARQYYTETSAQIDGDAQKRITEALQKGTLRAASQQETARILATTTTLEAALEAAHKVEDPETQDLVVARVKQEWEVKEHLKRQADEQMMIEIKNIIDDGGLKAVPTTTLRKLTAPQQTMFEQYAHRKDTGTAVETNLGTYDALNREMTNDPQQFMKENLLGYINKLSKSDFKHFSDQQMRMRSGDDKATKVIRSAEAQNQMVNGALRGISLDPTPPDEGSVGYNKEITDRVEKFRRAVRESVYAYETRDPNKPAVASDEEVQSIIDTLIAQTAKAQDRWWPAADIKPKYAFEEPTAFVTDIADVPARERARIAASLKRAGWPVTDVAILNAFNAGLKAMRR